MSSLVYYRLFTPDEIKEPLAEFSTAQVTRETTELRIGPDRDGERERIFKIKLLDQCQAENILPEDEDICIVIRFGSAVVPEKQDPLYVMITDNDRAIGFKISECGPIKGAEGGVGKFLDPVRLSGDDSQTASLSTCDWPDEFVITLKPKQDWGTIFCAQGNGTKQCVAYSRVPRFRRNGMYLDVYRHLPEEGCIINYIEIKIFVNSS